MSVGLAPDSTALEALLHPKSVAMIGASSSPESLGGRPIGLARAKDLLYSGRRVRSAEARELGLVDVWAGPDDVVEAARTYASSFTASSFTASSLASIALTKSILNQSYELSLADTAALGGQAQAICYTTDEHREAVAGFLRPSS